MESEKKYHIVDELLTIDAFIDSKEAIPNGMFEIPLKLIDAGIDYVELGTVESCTTLLQQNEIERAVLLAKQSAPDKAMNHFGLKYNPDNGSIPSSFKDAKATNIDYIRIVVSYDSAEDALSKIVEAALTFIELGYKCFFYFVGKEWSELVRFENAISAITDVVKPGGIILDSSCYAYDICLLKEQHDLLLRMMPEEVLIGFGGYFDAKLLLNEVSSISDSNIREYLLYSSVCGICTYEKKTKTEELALALNERKAGEYSVGTILLIWDYYLFIAFDYSYKKDTMQALAKYSSNAITYGTDLMDFISAPLEDYCSGLNGGGNVSNDASYNDELKQRLSSIRKTKWNKQLCIIVLTANRPESIAYYLRVKSREYSEIGIDLIIFDSSDDKRTEIIVKKYVDYKGSTTKYYRWEADCDGKSIDNKLIDAFKIFGKNYRYIWPCRDGWLINFPSVEADILYLLDDNPDCIVLYDRDENIDKLENRTKYRDSARAFLDHCRHMTILGSTIVSSSFAEKVIEQCPLDTVKNYGMWHPIAFFQYWGMHDIKLSLCIGQFIHGNIFSTPSSFWNKSGKALWQWAERWYVMIDNLPDCYDIYKKNVMKIEMADFHPFNLRELAIMRANGSISPKKIHENEFYLKNVSKTPMWVFRLFGFFPKSILRWYFDHPGNFVHDFLYKLYLLYKPQLNERKAITIYDKYCLQDIVFRKSVKNDIAQFDSNKLGIIVPTANRATEIDQLLNSVMEMYKNYNVVLTVFDSSSDDSTKKTVEKWQCKYPDFIEYSRFAGEVDTMSLDTKVISAYLKFADKYEYLWLIRDRLGIDFNQCARWLINNLNDGLDFVSIHNYEDDICCDGQKEYDHCQTFFSKQFINMTTLGNTIVKSETIKKIILEEALDKKENYGLWQPIAFFHYCSKHKFTAKSYVGDVFYYNSSAKKGSFGGRNILWQWVDRFYDILDNLPNDYKSEIMDMLLLWEDRYGLLKVDYLLAMRSRGYITKSKVDEVREKFPYVSSMPIEYLDRIARMSKVKAKHLAKKIAYDARIRNKYSRTDHTYIGLFNER